MQQLGISAQPKQVLEPEELSCWSSHWKAKAERWQHEVIVVWLVLRRPGTPWYSRMIAGCVVAYVVSPVQLIPSFIPVIGLMDDAAVIAAGLWLIRMFTPANILLDARIRAEAALHRGENMRPAAVRATTVIVGSVWLVLTIGLFVLWKR